MAAVREGFWNSRATGRDFFLLGLGLASGALTAALLMLQGEPIYHEALCGESPTNLSRIQVTTPTRMEAPKRTLASTGFLSSLSIPALNRMIAATIPRQPITQPALPGWCK